MQTRLEILPRIAALAALALLTACATGRPVLYPNAIYELGGSAEADQAVDTCLRDALAHGAHDPAGEVVTMTVGGAIRGMVDGAIIGAHVGHTRDGARLGAALGAIEGLFHGMEHAAHPDGTAQVFVERCLAESGYEVIGWR